MLYTPRNIKIACNHGGLTHFGGVHLFHEFLRLLQMRRFLTQHPRVDREILRRFHKLNRWRTEAVTLAIDRLLQKLWDKTTIFGRS
jgi:hypothetical protein